MTEEIQKLPQDGFDPNFLRKALYHRGLIDRAAQYTLDGSFSQRNPMLGPMKRCPFCHVRRHVNSPTPCCNAKFTVPAEGTPRSLFAKQRKNPRLSRKKPPMFLIHHRLVELEATPGYVEYDGIAGVVEAKIIREKKQKIKKRRQQQRQSRKMNRGHSS